MWEHCVSHHRERSAEARPRGRLGDQVPADRGVPCPSRPAARPPRVQLLDLQYHDISRERSPFYKLQDRGLIERICTDADIDTAVDVPPQTTRARLRGEFIKKAKERKRDYTVDWVHLKLNDQAQRTVLCKDPFQQPRRARREADRLALTRAGDARRCRRSAPFASPSCSPQPARTAAGAARRRQPCVRADAADRRRRRSATRWSSTPPPSSSASGTGGWHVVHWNLAAPRAATSPGPGHIMKMRYTSLQVDTGAAEEAARRDGGRRARSRRRARAGRQPAQPTRRRRRGRSSHLRPGTRISRT